MTDQTTYGPTEWTPDHYRGDGLQPFDVINAFDLDFYEGNAIKYLLRWRKKNGAEDLRKARTYVQILINRAEQQVDESRPGAVTGVHHIAKSQANEPEQVDEEGPEPDICRPVDVDGETIRVRGAGDFTEQDQEFAAEIVRAGKRKLAEEMLTTDDSPLREHIAEALWDASDNIGSFRTVDSDVKEWFRKRADAVLAVVLPHGKVLGARFHEAEAALALLHEGEEPYPDPTAIPTPAQWIWAWNRLAPAERLRRARQAIYADEAIEGVQAALMTNFLAGPDAAPVVRVDRIRAALDHAKEQ